MQQGLKLGILTYVHFCVDFACAFWVNYIVLFDGTWIGGVSCYVPANGNKLFWVMLYNFCAFALQLPLGMLADRLHQKKPWWMAAFGCALIGIAGVMGVCTNYTYYTMSRMFPVFILLGLGNALFHVGAGVRVLQMGEKMTPLGVFISTGAFGVCLGSVFCNTIQSERMYGEQREMLALFILILLLSFASVTVLLLGSKMDSPGMSVHKSRKKAFSQISVRKPEQDNTFRIPVHKKGQNDWLSISVHKNGQMDFVNGVSIVLLFLVVALRSFQGSFVQFSWKTGIPITLVFALCIVAGKALGGILADRFGVPLALIPLFLSMLLFLKSEDMFFGLAAILLFQTTMPITLSLMHKQLPALPGTAFGLLSFSLFVGYLPKFLSAYSGINVYGPRLYIGDWSFQEFSYRIAKWWTAYQKPYVYSIVTGISFLLLVTLLYLCYQFRKER